MANDNGGILRRVCVHFMAWLLFSAAAFPLAAQQSGSPQYASIVVDTGTGAILHAVNPDERAYPASLTKMMTLYLVFDALKSKRLTPDQRLPVSAHAQNRPPSKLGLRVGETITVRDAITALVTRSANDVAVVVAEALGETEARFAHLMTLRARELGMTRTVFRNASGLPNRHQVSTVRDMARLAIALQRDFPEYYHVFSTQSFTYRGQRHRNHNRLLTSFEGADGIKTGYIRASGFNVAVAAERNGRRLIGVTFGGQSAAARDSHMEKLLSNAFNAIFEGDGPSVTPLPTLVASAEGTKDRPAAERLRGNRGDTVVAAAYAAPIPPLKPDAPDAPDAAEGSAEIPSEDRWAVQVGAFNRYAPAHQAATRAAQELPSLQGLRVVIVPSKGQRGSLYRARLVGLPQDAARAACRDLRAKKFQCLPIRHETTLAATQ